MLFFEKHNYKSVEFLGNFLYKFEGLNEKNSFHYDKIVSTVFEVILLTEEISTLRFHDYFKFKILILETRKTAPTKINTHGNLKL